MFELRKDIPVPFKPEYPWATMEIGDCLVFTNEADYRKAVKSAKARSDEKFLFEDKKIWLISRAAEKSPKTRILGLLSRSEKLTQGVIVNRLRNFKSDHVLGALAELVDSGKVKTDVTQHRYLGRPVIWYRAA